MLQFFHYCSIVVFSVFIGSQITEGVLLVPYWQSLSSTDFYSYYNKFGPSIGRFYTVLTLMAAMIPLLYSIYCKLVKSSGFKYSLLSTLFAVMFVSAFFLYFKEANDNFYQAAFSNTELKKELVTWSYWHWSRVVIEFVSLGFLIISLDNIRNENIG